MDKELIARRDRLSKMLQHLCDAYKIAVGVGAEDLAGKIDAVYDQALEVWNLVQAAIDESLEVLNC